MSSTSITGTAVTDVFVEHDVTPIPEQLNTSSTSVDVVGSRVDVDDGEGESVVGRIGVQGGDEGVEVGGGAVVDDDDVDTGRVLHCRGCSRDLPESAFSLDASKPSGRHSRCHKCKKRGLRTATTLMVVEPRRPSKLLIFLPTPREEKLTTAPRRPVSLNEQELAVARRNAILSLIDARRGEFDRLCADERARLERARGQRKWMTIS